jgi:hypothetical protein
MTTYDVLKEDLSHRMKKWRKLYVTGNYYSYRHFYFSVVTDSFLGVRIVASNDWMLGDEYLHPKF